MATQKKSPQQEVSEATAQAEKDNAASQPPEPAKASDLPDPNPHVAGQTPAGETDQPDYQPANDYANALGDAQKALSNIHFNQSQPDTAPESVDPVIESVERALKALKQLKKESK